MNKQDILLKVATGLLNQGEQSVVEDGYGCEKCVYSTKEGLRCAVGFLIPDGHEALKVVAAVRGLLVGYPDLALLWEVSDDSDIIFLNDLQRLHDECDPSQWKDLLLDFALSNQLDPTPLYELELQEC